MKTAISSALAIFSMAATIAGGGTVDEYDRISLISTSSVQAPRRGVIEVIGQVRNPRSMYMQIGETLYGAILKAGGATEFGSMRRVKLYRDGTVRQYDLTQKASMTIPLQSNDVVEVPEKMIIGS